MQYEYTSWHEQGSEGMLEIAESANIGPNCYFDYTGGIRINSHSEINRNTMILTHDHQFHKSNWRVLPSQKFSCNIGRFVMVGAGSIICPKCVMIGHHSVIGAGSVVTKDVPAYEIWAGNPAHKIGDVHRE
jgi:acetyltransferase-like isoleucine patch superfamily enzyme